MDYAIVTLKNMISYNENVVPACLPSPDDDEKAFGDDELSVSGWGLTDNNYGSDSDVLLEIKLPVIPLEECYNRFTDHRKDYLFNNEHISSIFCAGTNSTDTSACAGDSGGKLYIK